MNVQDKDGRHRKRSSARRGQMMVIFALTLTVFIGAMMLGVDLSHMRAEAENAQRSANAAALAGAVFLPNFPSNAATRALGEAKKNGFIDGANGVSVHPSVPSNNPNRLTVTITETVPLVFGNVFGLGNQTVVRSATAEFAEPLEMGAPDYVLGYPAFPTSMASGATQGFYLETRGPYGQQENGDAYSQYFESFSGKGLNSAGTQTNLTDPCTGATAATDCDRSNPTTGSLKPNPDRSSINFDSYSFVVDIPGWYHYDPAHPNPLVLKIFDPFDESWFEHATGKLSGLHIAHPYDNEFTDQSSCTVVNTNFCYGNTSSSNPGNPVALQFTLDGPYFTTYDTTSKPVTPVSSGVSAGASCPSGSGGNCVLSNATVPGDNSFTAGDDPTYEACASAGNCSSKTSPYGYRFMNYAIITQPGFYRIHVKSVQNPSGIFAGTYGNGGNNYAFAICSDTAALGTSANPSKAPDGTSTTVSPVLTSYTTSGYPSGGAWNPASCTNPNSVANGAPSTGTTNCVTSPGLAVADACIHIYAENRMCIYNNLAGGTSSGGTSAIVPLGYVPAVYAGKVLHINLYDVGDVTNSDTPKQNNTYVQVLDPAGDLNHTSTSTPNGGFDPVLPDSWWVAPHDLGSGYVTDGSSSSPNSNPTGAPIGPLGGYAPYHYNGSWLNIDVNIPPNSGTDNYSSMTAAKGGYWKMLYNIGTDSQGNDTTTWQISVSGSPVHLVSG